MDHADPSFSPRDESEEKPSSPSRRRPWYRLHFSTWIVAGMTLAFLALIAVPARDFDHGYFTAGRVHEHGWPFVFLDRLDPAIPAGGVVLLTEIQKKHGLRRATLRDLGGTMAEFQENPPWSESENWIWAGPRAFHATGLVLDLVAVSGIAVAAGVLFEWWRRNRCRYSLRSLLLVFVLASAACAWWRITSDEHERESRAVAVLRDDGYAVHWRCDAPVWLRLLVGHKHLLACCRVVEVYPEWSDEPFHANPTPEQRKRASEIVDRDLHHVKRFEE